MDNPLFVRLTHWRGKRSIIAVPGTIAVGILASGLIFFLVVSGTSNYPGVDPMWAILAGLALLVLLILPIVVAAISVELTARDTTRDIYKLVCLSPLTNRNIVIGYFTAALFH